MIKVDVQAGGPGICRVSVAGDLDVCTAPAVRNVLREAVGWHARVDVDCGGVTFCDCTGLSALLAAAKAAKGAGSELRLCAVPHPWPGCCGSPVLAASSPSSPSRWASRPPALIAQVCHGRVGYDEAGGCVPSLSGGW
ncbi:STAS domain-containing protein [Streptomyces aureus]